jgi:hypothetical protein
MPARSSRDAGPGVCSRARATLAAPRQRRGSADPVRSGHAAIVSRCRRARPRARGTASSWPWSTKARRAESTGRCSAGVAGYGLMHTSRCAHAIFRRSVRGAAAGLCAGPDGQGLMGRRGVERTGGADHDRAQECARRTRVCPFAGARARLPLACRGGALRPLEGARVRAAPAPAHGSMLDVATYCNNCAQEASKRREGYEPARGRMADSRDSQEFRGFMERRRRAHEREQQLGRGYATGAPAY